MLASQQLAGVGVVEGVERLASQRPAVHRGRPLVHEGEGRIDPRLRGRDLRDDGREVGLGLLEAQLGAVVPLAEGAELLVRRLDVVLELLGLGLLVADRIRDRTGDRAREPSDDGEAHGRDEAEVTDVAEQGG